jgi:hypothetical protein
VPSGQWCCAASSLLTGLFDGEPVRLPEETRTRVSVHYATGDPDLPVLCVGTLEAVRLPGSLVVPALPGSGTAYAGRGRLVVGRGSWRVVRWWRPPRASALGRPAFDVRALLPREDRLLGLGVPVPCPSYGGLNPAELVGAGPGLTPAGDDVLAGALVAAYATGDPRLAGWSRQTRDALSTHRTTAVSRAMLHHALDGYATPELAGYVTAVCRGGDVERAGARLEAVGHTSGTALLAGVLHTLGTYELRGAA